MTKISLLWFCFVCIILCSSGSSLECIRESLDVTKPISGRCDALILQDLFRSYGSTRSICSHNHPAPSHSQFPEVQFSPPDQDLAIINQTCHLFSLLHENIRKPHLSAFTGDRLRPRVVVIGGGPMGLASAIQSYSLGSNVTVVEKRTEYTRNVWLDMSPQPWAPTQDVLAKWGFHSFSAEKVTHPGTEIFTVRVQILERFLSRVLMVLGVPIHYGAEFSEICPPESEFLDWSVLAKRSDPARASCAGRHRNSSDFLFLDFDILIGADGSKSRVRKVTNTPFQPHTTFHFGKFGKKRLSVPKNQVQHTVIVDFKPEVDNSPTFCPKLKPEYENHSALPWDIGFDLPHVHSVFKRFYMGHCHMQVLFSAGLGQKLWENPTNQNPLLWETLCGVADHLFEKGCRENSEIQNMVTRDPEGNFEIVFLAINTKKVGNDTILLTGARKSAVVTFVGDAAFTPHYRLGVGVNNGFSGLSELGDLIRAVGDSGIQKSVALKNKRSGKRLGDLADVQTSTIFFESKLGLVVSFDFAETDLKSAQKVFVRNREDRTYDEADYHELFDLLKKKK